ncbi:DNA mismatch repair endonuclease MutH [Psychromonas sp. 14N.309.X.WAT.B.A12]|uniref:DNA mismatch repair endonuclease MutH n=1 Tax=unclassified Psychromonas TaxID=2614957 RepID=UPI0025B14996|nr:DNA mismatch repair endonuclease MutH [Psychromonas sp. 14N.309.X.WAT.B.A12]MDN2663497.1 DNA mismatch repair endonuclease MutH [Psychromonas sp. 14N.309.X.WAT.B.A12]
MQPTPTSESQLLNYCEAIAGFSLSELADIAGIITPENLRKNKGWVGQLIEWHLGASAGSKPEQDFKHLGIELKTIPIDSNGKVLETTFVCSTPILNTTHLTWENSNIRNKLSKVLWLPVQGERKIPLAERLVGNGFLWTASAQQEQLMRQDWNELMEKIALGKIEQISARDGQVLQLRPKAANGQVVTDAYGEEGELIKVRPRGFYLKKAFTQDIINQQFNLNV